MSRHATAAPTAQPTASPFARRTLAQLRMELRLTGRRGENVLATLVIPVALLLFFAAYPIGLAAERPAIDRIVPSIVAVAVISAGLVNLGIATAYERAYGVLKRLGASPLSTTSIVVAKIGAVAFLEVVQLVLIVGVAVLLLGWRPVGLDAVAAGVALALGTATFSALGLLLAGTLRAEAVLALANGLFLASVLVGGVVVPPSQLPPAVASVVRLLPAAALADTLRGAFAGPTEAVATAWSVAILAIWTVVSVAAAARTFRWE